MTTIEGEPRYRFVERREQFIDVLRSDPTVLNDLDVVPAYLYKGVKPGVRDISLLELSTRVYGIGRPKETSGAIAHDIGVGRSVVKATAPLMLEVIRRTRFADDARIDSRPIAEVSEGCVEQWRDRIREFQEMHRLFAEPSRHEYFEQLLSTQLFNRDSPPEVVRTVVERSVQGIEVEPELIPRVEDFLRSYYGIGRSRMELQEISELTGYTPSWIGTVKDGLLWLLNRNLRAAFPETAASRTHGTATMIETNRQFQVRAQKEGVFLHPREAAPISDHVRRLLFWGIHPQVIADFINRYSVSVTRFGAPPVDYQFVNLLDQELRGLRISRWIGHRDRAEQAARFLLKIEVGEVRNKRAELVVSILKMLSEGYTSTEVAVHYGLDYKEFVTRLINEARAELRDDPRFRSEIDQLYLDELGMTDAAKLRGHSMTSAISAVNSKLLPLYVDFRRQLGDRPEEGLYASFSPREYTILELLARGEGYTDIARTLRGSAETGKKFISVNAKALLDSDFGRATTREQVQEENRMLHTALAALAADENRWWRFYSNREQLLTDLEVLDTLLSTSSYGRTQDMFDITLSYVLSRARAVAKSLHTGQDPIWRSAGWG